MKSKITDRQKRLYLIAAIIMLVGLGSAAFIYLTADDAADHALIRNFENSKRYVHTLELYGGKLNVLADRFYRWFYSLWQGTSLAFTIACITIPISLGFCLVARSLPSDSEEKSLRDSFPQ